MKHDLLLDNIAIEYVHVFDFLGLTTCETLDWSHHVIKISNKIAKIVGIMNRIKRIVHWETLKIIYNSLILPHLYYCVLAWGFNNNRLFKLQKKSCSYYLWSKI